MDRHPLVYRKGNTNVFVEAMQLGDDNVDAIANWAQAQVVTEHDALAHDERFEALNVRTLDGMQRCSRGMFVAKYHGNFYVAKEGDFKKLYSPVIE